MGGDTYGDLHRVVTVEQMNKMMEAMYGASAPAPKPINPLEKFDDVDLMMELIKRGYAVHLPLENADKLR